MDTCIENVTTIFMAPNMNIYFKIVTTIFMALNMNTYFKNVTTIFINSYYEYIL